MQNSKYQRFVFHVFYVSYVLQMRPLESMFRNIWNLGLHPRILPVVPQVLSQKEPQADPANRERETDNEGSCI